MIQPITYGTTEAAKKAIKAAREVDNPVNAARSVQVGA